MHDRNRRIYQSLEGYFYIRRYMASVNSSLVSREVDEGQSCQES